MTLRTPGPHRLEHWGGGLGWGRERAVSELSRGTALGETQLHQGQGQDGLLEDEPAGWGLGTPRSVKVNPDLR